MFFASHKVAKPIKLVFINKMDKYVVREPRVGADYPQGNQMIAFSPNTRNNNSMIPPETMYFGGYGAEFNVQRVNSSGFIGMTHVTPYAHTNLLPGQGQVMSGIDPRYLAAYGDNNAAFIAGPQRQQMHMERNSTATNSPFAGDYQNRNFAGVERNKSKTFPQAVAAIPLSPQHEQVIAKSNQNEAININRGKTIQKQQDFHLKTATKSVVSVPTKQNKTEIEILKNEFQNPSKTRFDKLKALYKSGPRAFSGPVEKVLKWHKALQDIGVLVLYEIVAKCVNVRPGESCSKNLVVRDDSGPAMQVVYYEIDFLLPEFKPPCTVRVIGRMMPGTCRLQAFHVRPATGDDVATLPRRAAVAAHHVAKLCKEYNVTG